MRKRIAKKIISRLLQEQVKAIEGKNVVRIKRWNEALNAIKSVTYIVNFPERDVELFARYKDSKSRYIYDDRVTKIYRVKKSKIKNF